MRSRLPVFIIPMVFLITGFLSGETSPETIYTDDKYYITYGTLVLDCPISTVSVLLLDLEHYRDWAFRGMGKSEPDEEWHIAYLQDAIYNRQESVMYVIFGVHLFRASTRSSSGNSLGFRTIVTMDDYGRLASVTFSLNEKNSFLREADYGFDLSADGEKTIIHYFGNVRLSPFIDFFFNLKTYKSNVEWYAVRLVDNLVSELTGE